MRILALVTDAYGGYGGIAQYNRDLFRAVASLPIVQEIVVLPRTAGGSISEKPTKVLQLRARAGRGAYSNAALNCAWRQGPFDVVFCGHLYHLPLAALIRRWFGARIWLQAHGIDAWEHRSRLVAATIQSADLVTTVSRYTRRRLLSWSGLNDDRVRVLPNTVRPEFTPGPKSVAILKKFSLPTDAKLVLTVSRLSEADAYKGHDRVIDAMVEVLKAEPHAVYVVVGDGDGRAKLESLAQKSGLGNAIRFLGRLNDADVLALYRSADLFVMPSTAEGFGIVFVEAAAAGLRVIGGSRDGSVDALADGQIGRLIDPLSHDELVEAVIERLKERSRGTPQAARRFAFSNFETHVDGLLKNFAF